MRKDDKKFNQDELEAIKDQVNKALKPINGKIKIKNPPHEFNCSSKKRGEKRVEWKGRVYNMEIDSDLGECEIRSSFFSNVDLSEVIWITTYKIWKEIDGNINSDLANNIWPKESNLKPEE